VDSFAFKWRKEGAEIIDPEGKESVFRGTEIVEAFKIVSCMMDSLPGSCFKTSPSATRGQMLRSTGKPSELLRPIAFKN